MSDVTDVYVVAYDDPWEHFTVTIAVFSSLDKAKAACPGEWLDGGDSEWVIYGTRIDGAGREFPVVHRCNRHTVDEEAR